MQRKGYTAYSVNPLGITTILHDTDFCLVMSAIKPYLSNASCEIQIEDCFGLRTIPKQELNQVVGICNSYGKITQEQLERFSDVCEVLLS